MLDTDTLSYYLLRAQGDNPPNGFKGEIQDFCDDLKKEVDKINECFAFLERGIAPYKKEREEVKKEFQNFKTNLFDKCFYYDTEGCLLVNSAKVLELFGQEADDWKNGL